MDLEEMKNVGDAAVACVRGQKILKKWRTRVEEAVLSLMNI